MNDKPKHICYIEPVDLITSWVGNNEIPRFQQYVVHATLDEITDRYVVTSKTLIPEF